MLRSFRQMIRRSPSWGAWIEMIAAALSYIGFAVAPPRGERGLKLLPACVNAFVRKSLPLVGSVD